MSASTAVESMFGSFDMGTAGPEEQAPLSSSTARRTPEFLVMQ
jgi:hypothetical protein